jgi:hypothetical protein
MVITAGYYANLSRTAQGVDRNTQQAIEQLGAMSRSLDQMIDQSQPPSYSSPAMTNPNSLEARAKREMEKLQRQHGLNPPPVGPDGRVHLQSGGSLSQQEYDRLRRTLEPP